MLLQNSSDDESQQEEIDLFRDLDLAILGWDISLKCKKISDSSCDFFSASTDDYQKYSKNVSLEYASDDYQKDRLKMLKTLLTIPFIFSTQSLRDKFERNARINIQTEIDNI